MGEWPKRYHRARYDDTGNYVIDAAVTVVGYQLQPTTWEALAVWCSGAQVLDDDGNQAVAVNGSLATNSVARLGDFVMQTAPTRYEVSRADGHYQRWATAE